MACEDVVDVAVMKITAELEAALSHLDLESERAQDSLTVRKKTRDLKSGDIIVPKGCVKLNEVQVGKVLEHMQVLAGKTGGNIQRVTSDKHSLLAFYLNRSKIYKDILREVEDKGEKYGHTSLQFVHSIFLNLMQSRSCDAAQKSPSLTDLRIHVLQNHIRLLLEANGYKVLLKGVQEDDLSSLINKEDRSNSDASTLQENEHSSQYWENSLIEKAKMFSLTSKETKDKNVNNTNDQEFKSGCPTGEKYNCGDNISMDLKKIITDRGFCNGKDGFDKNLSQITVLHENKPTELLLNVADLAASLNSVSGSKSFCDCLHLVPHNQGFKLQQIQLALDALTEQNFRQSQLVVGPVTLKSDSIAKSADMLNNASNFYQERYEQMKEASEMRYGCVTEGEDGDPRVKLLTNSSIKMDILGNAAHSPLRLDPGSIDRGAESRIGSFVLYNTARLATLMEHFDQGVQKGMYPGLPSVADTDFSLLREEEDWEILYLYIATFPSVVKHSVESIFPEGGKNLAKIHTHKVTSFLTSFCKCLSAHYSRYHILTGGEKHLLPLMYARLHLMKASHQVLVNSLELIGVKALTYL